MFVTTIGALLYTAYESFFMNLPNAAALADKQKLTVGQVTAANIIIGVVALILIVAALFLAYDALRAMRGRMAEGRAVTS